MPKNDWNTMTDSREKYSTARRCCVIGRRRDFGLPPDDGGEDGGFVVFNATRTRHGIETDPDPMPLSQAIPFDENSVVTGLVNVREAVTCRLTAPFEKRSKAEKVLPTLLDIKLPFPLEECVYVFIGFSREPEGTSALGVAARSSDIESTLRELTDEGADPVILDHEGLALWTQSIIERPDVNDAEIRAVLQIGSRNWTLVLGSGGDYIGSYNIRPSDMAHIRRIIKATASTLNKSGAPGEESADGLTGSRDSSASVQLLLCGCGLQENEAANRVRQEFSGSGTRVEVLNQPAGFLARGMAQRALEEGPLRCNLRTAAFEHPDVAKQAATRTRIGGVALALAGALLCGVNIAVSELAARRETAMDSKLKAMRTELMGYSIQALGDDAQNKVRSETLARIGRLEPFFKMKRRESISPVVYSAAKLGAEKDLEYDSLSIAPGNIEMKGTAPLLGAAVSLRKYLEGKGYKSEIQGQSGKFEGGRIGFLIEGQTE